MVEEKINHFEVDALLDTGSNLIMFSIDAYRKINQKVCSQATEHSSDLDRRV